MQCATVLARLFSKNGVVCVLDLLKNKLDSSHCGFFLETENLYMLNLEAQLLY